MVRAVSGAGDDLNGRKLESTSLLRRRDEGDGQPVDLSSTLRVSAPSTGGTGTQTIADKIGLSRGTNPDSLVIGPSESVELAFRPPLDSQPQAPGAPFQPK